MIYTSTDLVTIFAALGVLITAVGAVIVNIVVAVRTANKIDLAAQKTDGLVNQVHEVHTLTNSNLSAVKAELAQAIAKIAGLVELVQDLRSEREKAAIASALSTPVPGPVAATAVVENLESIKVNTEETARNTAKTDAAVKALTNDAP